MLVARGDNNAQHPPIIDDPSSSSSSSSSSEPSSGATSPSSEPPTSARSTGLAPPPSSTTLRSRAMAILSPRSTNYERLEGGMGPGRMANKRFAWKKFAIAAGVLIAIVWFVGPREPRSFSWSPAKGKDYGKNVDTAPLPGPPLPAPTRPDTKPGAGADKTKPAGKPADPPAPASFEADPDPTKTTHCAKPHTPGAPLVQYALMLDAGSTGSRIHVYKFNNCGPSPEYEYEVFKMTQPGLSDFAGDPLGAARSLDVLLDEAVRVVPQALRACTPLAVKATAGLRLLAGSQSADILKAVEKRLREEYPFQVAEEGAVEIMDGKDEGVYAWITANYLLDTIRAGSAGPGGKAPETWAVLDLGGASTQIVFEPVFAKPDAAFVEGDHRYDLEIGGRKHVLYQHSYLGYGLKRARQHVHQLVEFMASLRLHNATAAPLEVVGNPCLARGTQRLVEVEDERSGAKRNVTMDGEEIGSFEACNRVVELVMAKDAICETKPCSFNGVYQPSLLDTFPSGRSVLLLSYFYDRLSPLLPPKTTINAQVIAATAKDVCLGRPAWLRRWGTRPEVMEELVDRPEWCLDLTFMYGLLRLGYEFEEGREFEIGKKMQDTELGWCLGATLAMVGGTLECRV